MPDVVAARGEVARLGYRWRLAETEAFSAARVPLPGLVERLRTGERAEDVAAELADAEPLSRPEPSDDTASWRTPGPGGHVRHYGALACIDAAGYDDRALKREWLYGFFYRCCEEVSSP